MNILRLLFSLHLLAYLFPSYEIKAQTQQKFEREFFVRESNVPLRAKAFIDSLNVDSRIKWFIEEGLERKSFEAKFRWKGLRYSIEFDTTGLLEDAEVDVKPKHIEPNTLTNIKTKLSSDFSKYKIEKTQIQYSGKTEDVLLFLKKNESQNQTTKRYELEVVGTVNRRKKLFEYLFTDSGAFIERSEVVLRSTDNLEY